MAEAYPECEIEPHPKCECDCYYPAKTCTEYFKCKLSKMNKFSPMVIPFESITNKNDYCNIIQVIKCY